MKKIFAILACLVLFSSCSIDWNGEKDKKIAELETKLTENIFERNLKCNSLEQEMKKFALEFYGEESEIRNIFFSPKRNSCLFSVYSVRKFGSTTIYILDIMDILTKESIYGIDSSEIFLFKDVVDGNCYKMEDKCNNYNQKIKELKGE